MVSEVDHQLGRLRAHLESIGQWADTFVVVTADHADLLGDHGLLGKLGWWSSSYHIIGIVRDPRPEATRGIVIDRLTENVDIFPTLCDVMGIDVPAQCDGLPLTPLLHDVEPPWWRTAAHWEFDWRDQFPPPKPGTWPWDRRPEHHSVAVSLHGGPDEAERAFVQFAGGTALAFDLMADPTWQTRIDDPTALLAMAQAQLAWRAQHAERTMTGTILDGGVRGRVPIDAAADA